LKNKIKENKMTYKLCWLTDIHLDHYCNKETKTIKRFCEEVMSFSPDGIVITGDITNGLNTFKHFSEMTKEWKDIPVYFVLGNHDFYGSSFDTVRKKLHKAIDKHKNFHYLTDLNYVEITPNCAITGHDGWYDGGYGNWFDKKVVVMNDYYFINDFFTKSFIPPTMTKYDKRILFNLLQQEAQKCANHILRVLPDAISKYKKVIFATHVPPFKEASIYNGKVSNKNFLPNYSSKIAGDALLSVATSKKAQNKKIVVLCGHTHGDGICQPYHNIICYTGYSDYGNPISSLKIMEIE
jgi:Icc-related predicted phosphoesterase